MLLVIIAVVLTIIVISNSSKKIPVIFYNLRGYDSYLIMEKIRNFKLNGDVIPNGLEKYMTFAFNGIFL